MTERKHKTGWILLVIGTLALIITPFMIWGDQVDEWTLKFLKSAGSRPFLTASVLGGLLASDILLPIPSSIVSTGCGILLGTAAGTITSLAGMIISCITGYWLGRAFGRPAAIRLVGGKDIEKFEEVSRRFGIWALVIARPVPVLAEVSILFAGISRVPFPRFMLVTSLSNLGISLGYAAIGSLAADLNSFLTAFFAGICLPGLFMLVTRRLKKSS